MRFLLIGLFCISIFSPIVSTSADPTKKYNFLAITDIHLEGESKHRMEISPAKNSIRNDLDNQTFVDLLAKIDVNLKNGTIPRPDFVLLLGDLVGHLRWSSQSAINDEKSVFKLLSAIFPNTPILYTFGNNDSLKKNYGPFTDPSRPEQYKSPYAIAKSAGGWLNGFLSTGTVCKSDENVFPCLINENSEAGYYSAYLRPKFRYISLNTILFSQNRRGISDQEALQQLDWLQEQLKTAKQHQESVLIAMHIPPGRNVYDHSAFWLPKEQEIFLKLIKTYQSSIVGLLASHTHYDEIKIIKDASGKLISAIYFAPSLSTLHSNEPSIKTFYFFEEAGRWFLSNYITFHFSLKGQDLLFSKLYDYRSYYCNKQQTKLIECLAAVTAEKMAVYYRAGNQNYKGKVLGSPQDMFLITGENA